MTTIVTLAMENDAQQWFNRQREAHFPPALNHIGAHLTLFHALPGGHTTEHVLREAATAQLGFTLRLDGVRSMGRGVMYTLSSPKLMALHRALAAQFGTFLIPQDCQALRPHVVVQNKVEPHEAKALLGELQAVFTARSIRATGLEWWEYLRGPWKLLERFPFAESHSSFDDREQLLSPENA